MATDNCQLQMPNANSSIRQAMVFAAGLGTRLKPLTDTMPKALVPVGGKPLIGHVLEKLVAAGFNRIVVNVHHFAPMIKSWLAERTFKGVEIIVSDESDQLLDTGGGLRKAANLFDADAPILIHNVDILSDIDLKTLYDAHADNDATLLVSRRETSRYLLFDDDMRLCGWTNTRTGEVRPADAGLNPAYFTRLAFSGIHVFSPRLFASMAAFPAKFGIIDFYLQACRDRNIRGFDMQDLRLLDVGKLNTLSEAEEFIKH